MAPRSLTWPCARVETTPHLLALGPGFVLYALMDFIVDQYFPVIDALEMRLEDLEDSVFGESYSRATTAQLYRLQRELVEIKRVISPLVEICSRLARFDHEAIPEATHVYFRDVYDHVVHANEMADTLRELLGTTLGANFSLISITQNEVMKRFAGWAAIIAVPTMVAGIYGMNFEFMPEVHHPASYPLMLAGTVTVCAALFYYFRRAGWL
jgi:magnesium transporter